jgi:hypothetical protein
MPSPLNPNVALKTWRRMFNMLNFLKNKTFYDIGIDILAGEARNRVRFRPVFTLRESRRTPGPALQRGRGRRLRLHPLRLGSETLRLLHRWDSLKEFKKIFPPIDLSQGIHLNSTVKREPSQH